MSGPLLVFGMPRSGTTWIGKIFDSHPDTVYRHEPDTSQPIDSIPLLPDMQDAALYRNDILQYVESVRRMFSSRVCGKLPIFPKSYMSSARLWLVRTSVALSKVAAKSLGEVPVLGVPGQNAGALVWKSIESLGRLGVMLECLPSARAIHILRHPCGFVASVLRGEAQSRFVSRTPASEDFNLLKMLLSTQVAEQHGLTFDGLMRMSANERLAWRWVLFNEKAYQELAGCDRYLHVVYEDVCRDALSQTKLLMKFAGLGWNAQTEAFVEASTRTQKDDYYGVYKDPLAAAERWRDELDRSLAEEILSITERSEVGRFFADTRDRQSVADQNTDI